MTDGLEVLVQLVIAAITTDPFSTLASGLAATATAARPLIGPPSSVRREIASGSGLGDLVNAVVKLFQTSGSATRSCGRFGPATLDRPSPQNSTNLSTTPCLRSISVSVSTRSVAVDPAGRAPVNRTPTTTGDARYAGWPRIAASASIPPVPQPRTPRPLTIVVWESVPIRVSGIATFLAPRSRTWTTFARYSRLTWWQMPMPGGTSEKLWNACCAQRKSE